MRAAKDAKCRKCGLPAKGHPPAVLADHARYVQSGMALERAQKAITFLSDDDRARLKEALGFKDPTYNGWKNYETWCVSLWIDNEESTYNRARFMAREAAEEARELAEDAAGPALREKRVVIVRSADGILADRLKEWIEEAAPDLGASMFSDLLGAALSEVDWFEIAHAMQGE